MQEKIRTRLIYATAGVVVGTMMATTLSAVADGIANPTQQQALDGLETARNYIQAHPDVTVPPTTPPPTTTVPPTTNPPASAFPSGMPWRSGVNPQWQGAVNVEAFKTMRGKPVDIIVIHPARDDWARLNADWAYTEPIPTDYVKNGGRLSFAMPLWPGNGNATTNYNTQWTAWANRVEALDPKTDVRLGWEMNLPWRADHINPGNQNNWVAAFNRAAVSIKNACPGCTITWNPNWGGDQTDVDTRVVFQQVKANVHNYGIDYYDAWPKVTDANSNSRRDQFRSLTDSYNYAIANGKKFALPEWGVVCATCWEGQGGGDNPKFINHVMNFLKSKPANTIAYDAYFDEPDEYIHSELRAPTVNRDSAAAYRAQITALTQ